MSIGLAIFFITLIMLFNVVWIENYNNSYIKKESAVLILKNNRNAVSSAVHIGNGYVLTSLHGISDDTEIELTTESAVMLDSKLLWTSNFYDIALYQIDKYNMLEKYTVDCTPLELHEELTFKGNPLNLRHISLKGIVAGKTILDMTKDWSHLVPVQATIAPGMSGGPAIDTSGKLRGINIGSMVQRHPVGHTFVGVSYIVPTEAICKLLAR